MEEAICTKNIRSYGNYSEALKLEVVEAVFGKKLSQSEACSKYGIKGHSTILKWMRKYQGAKMTRMDRKSTKMAKAKETEKLLEEKKLLEQALLKSTVRIHCLEALIEEAETRYGTDLKKAYIQRS